MKKIIALTAGLSLFALAACDNGDKKEETNPATEPSSEAPATAGTAPDTATEVVDAVALDTSSLDAFRQSLENMKASLSADDQGKLDSALSKLTAEAAGNSEGGSALSMAKDMADGKSMEELLYDKMGGSLNGLTFEDILTKAG